MGVSYAVLVFESKIAFVSFHRDQVKENRSLEFGLVTRAQVNLPF